MYVENEKRFVLIVAASNVRDTIAGGDKKTQKVLKTKNDVRRKRKRVGVAS